MKIKCEKCGHAIDIGDFVGGAVCRKCGHINLVEHNKDAKESKESYGRHFGMSVKGVKLIEK